jgi:hypothetical protein
MNLTQKTIHIFYFTCGRTQEKTTKFCVFFLKEEIMEKVGRLFKASDDRPCVQGQALTLT